MIQEKPQFGFMNIKVLYGKISLSAKKSWKCKSKFVKFQRTKSFFEFNKYQKYIKISFLIKDNEKMQHFRSSSFPLPLPQECKNAKSNFCFAKVGHVVKVYQDKPVNKRPMCLIFIIARFKKKSYHTNSWNCICLFYS